MGHLVNPISLRLGRTQKWKSQWFKPSISTYISIMKEDFVLYNYVESFFKYARLLKKRSNAVVKFRGKFIYSLTSANLPSKQSKSVKRKKHLYLRPSQRKRVRVRRYVKSKIIEKLSLVFSHANILRYASNLNLNLNIYDGAFEVLKKKQYELDLNALYSVGLGVVEEKGKANVSRQKLSTSIEASSSTKAKVLNKMAQLNLNNKILVDKEHLKARTMLRVKKKAVVPVKKKRKKLLKNLLSPKEYLRNFLHLSAAKLKRKPYTSENIFQRLLIKRPITYDTNIISTNFFNYWNSRNKSFQVQKALAKTQYRKNICVKSVGSQTYLDKKKSKSALNLELRFFNTRFHHLRKSLKSFFFHSVPSRKIEVKKNYFRILKLLGLLLLKKTYANRLEKIFLLRLILYSTMQLRLAIARRLRKLINKSLLKKNTKYLNRSLYIYIKKRNFARKQNSNRQRQRFKSKPTFKYGHTMKRFPNVEGNKNGRSDKRYKGKVTSKKDFKLNYLRRKKQIVVKLTVKRGLAHIYNKSKKFFFGYTLSSRSLSELQNNQNTYAFKKPYRGREQITKNSNLNYSRSREINNLSRIAPGISSSLVKRFKAKNKIKEKKKLLFVLRKKLVKFKRNYNKLNNFLLYILCLCSQYSIDYGNYKLYRLRFKTWFYVSRVLFENIKTIVKTNVNTFNYTTVQITYLGLTNLTPTAAMLAIYITNKLYQKYTIFETLKPVARDLSKNFTIEGFKISCAGRLTKKQRASLFVQKDKRVPANTFDSFIDYATSIVRLRHGVCGLKVWITRKKTFKPFDYSFSYTYQL